jgi:uncharacterized protein
MSRLPALPFFLLIALMGLATGCAQQSQPSTFYVLSYAQDREQTGSITTMREGLSVGIGPVELPQYLDRPQIVTRASDNQLEIEEFDRWGGRLKENFTIVLAEVLSAELETDRISAHPWASPDRIEIQVIVNVTAFETDTAGRSRLEARWSIVDVRRQDVLVTARSVLRQEVAAPSVQVAESVDYDAIAAAMSRNVAELGREIAMQIRSHSSS